MAAALLGAVPVVIIYSFLPGVRRGRSDRRLRHERGGIIGPVDPRGRGERAMVIRVTWGKLRAGSWNEYERTYRANVLTKGKNIKGLRGRWLAQDDTDKDTGFAVSLWDNMADMKTYEESPLYREIMAPLQPFFVGDYKTYRCEVKYDSTA
jgi:heme-degrading monooxygenase HmoA